MKKLIVAGTVATLGLAGLAGGTAFATTHNGNGPMSDLPNAIATKFHLNESDVQKVFDEQRAKMDAAREQDQKAELAQLIKDGKLIQEQADKITAKRTELDKEREVNRTSDQNLTDEQRKAKMDEHKTALDTWLKDNDIDSQYSYLLIGGRSGHGGRGMHGDRNSQQRGQQSAKTATSSSSSATND